jgi:hypothetical protein
MVGRIIQGFFVGGGSRPVLAKPGPGGNGRFEIDPATVGLVARGGAPLAPTILAKMESAFGESFSAVRVHAGPQASRIGALAFTTGNDIYFAPGRYQPETVQGQQLLGHELAHVVQQRQGRVRAGGSGVYVVHDRALEAEADRLGARAAATSIQPKRAAERPRLPMRPASGLRPSGVTQAYIVNGKHAAAGPQSPGTIQRHPLTIKIAGYQAWARDTSEIQIEDDIELFRQKIDSSNSPVVSIEMRKKHVGDHQVVVVGTADGRFTQFDVGVSGAILRYHVDRDHYSLVTGTYDPTPNLRLHDVFRAFFLQTHARGFESDTYNCVRFAADFVGRIGTPQRNRGPARGGARSGARATYTDDDAINDLFG